MHDYQLNIIEKIFQEFIQKNKLCNRNDKILLGISGGIDSMVMLYMFLKTGYDISIAHANFRLRGNESDRDENFVHEFCKKKQLRCFIRQFDTKEYARVNHCSVEMAARELRYNWFKELCQQHGFSKIAVAHNKNDHAETILLNLCRGTSLKGLEGLKPIRDNIIRPMLCFSRKDIEDYALTENIVYMEDSSNQDISYPRNRIRHHVIPELLKINPSLLDTLKNNAVIFTQTEKFLEEKLAEILSQIVEYQDDELWIKLDLLKDSKHADLILYRILNKYDLTFDQFSEIKKLIAAQTGKSVKINDFLFTKNRNYLITSKFNKPDEIHEEINFNKHEKLQKHGNLTIEILNNVHPEEIKNQAYAYLDADKIESPLILRTWKTSDRFIPYGMKSPKKVSDFLTDIKFPAHLRKNVKVLLSSGQIVWVTGLRIADPFKVTEKTSIILKITLINK